MMTMMVSDGNDDDDDVADYDGVAVGAGDDDGGPLFGGKWLGSRTGSAARRHALDNWTP